MGAVKMFKAERALRNLGLCVGKKGWIGNCHIGVVCLESDIAASEHCVLLVQAQQSTSAERPGPPRMDVQPSTTQLSTQKRSALSLELACVDKTQCLLRSGSALGFPEGALAAGMAKGSSLLDAERVVTRQHRE